MQKIQKFVFCSHSLFTISVSFLRIDTCYFPNYLQNVSFKMQMQCQLSQAGSGSFSITQIKFGLHKLKDIYKCHSCKLHSSDKIHDFGHTL